MPTSPPPTGFATFGNGPNETSPSITVGMPSWHVASGAVPAPCSGTMGRAAIAGPPATSVSHTRGGGSEK